MYQGVTCNGSMQTIIAQILNTLLFEIGQGFPQALYRGTSLIRKRPPLRRALGIVLLLGPSGRRFLVSEVLERCPPRQKSRVERLKAKVEPPVTVDTWRRRMSGSRQDAHVRISSGGAPAPPTAFHLSDIYSLVLESQLPRKIDFRAWVGHPQPHTKKYSQI